MSPEELEVIEHDQLEAMLVAKEVQARTLASVKHSRHDSQDADKWRNFKQEAFLYHSSLWQETAVPKAPVTANVWDGTHDLVTHATDLHYGKYGNINETGNVQNRATTTQALLTATTNLIQRAKRLTGGPGRHAIVGVGGDLFHIDTPHGTTTKGTKQDHDGSMFEIFTGGTQLTIAQIEMFAANYEKTTIKFVRGNHDEFLMCHLAYYLALYFQDDERVVIEDPPEASRVYVYGMGDTQICFTHGDNYSHDKLRLAMAQEDPINWGSAKHRMCVTGHVHSQNQSENFGIIVHSFPSLACADYWHKKKAYVGNDKVLQGIVLTEEGPIAKLTARPDPNLYR